MAESVCVLWPFGTAPYCARIEFKRYELGTQLFFVLRVLFLGQFPENPTYVGRSLPKSPTLFLRI